MSPKPTEVRLVASLLHEEADDANDLARRIIEGLDDKRDRDDTMYVVVYFDPNTKALITYGPYKTQRAADKALGTLVSPGPLPAQGAVRKLVGVPA